MAYSIDYRKAAIEFKQDGHTFAQLKKVFKITSKTYYEWIELLEKTGFQLQLTSPVQVYFLCGGVVTKSTLLRCIGCLPKV